MNPARIAVVGLGVLLLVLITVAIARGLSHSSPQPSAPTDLTRYTQQDAQVRLTIEGPVVADELYHSTVITVSPTSKVMTTYKTYSDQININQAYGNNGAAFDEFIRALQYAGFSHENLRSTQDNERGFCPTGEKYVYELINGGTTVFRFWSSSCGDRQQTLAGSGPRIRQLFRAQIPDYNRIEAGKQPVPAP